MSEAEAPFPPRTWLDIRAYDTDDVVAGYREHRLGDPAPGGNRSPSYRWGWTNARRDASLQEDGFESLRHEFITITRSTQ